MNEGIKTRAPIILLQKSVRDWGGWDLNPTLIHPFNKCGCRNELEFVSCRPCIRSREAGHKEIHGYMAKKKVGDGGGPSLGRWEDRGGDDNGPDEVAAGRKRELQRAIWQEDVAGAGPAG